MIQQCVRWLVPVEDSWVAAEYSGKRRHYAPTAEIGRTYRLARCGNWVSPTRTERLKANGRWDQLIPCQRCMDSLIR